MQARLVQLLKNLGTWHTARVYENPDKTLEVHFFKQGGYHEVKMAYSRAEAAQMCWDWCFPDLMEGSHAVN